MNLIEKMVRAHQNNEPMPLKGHTKITLTDVKTGKAKVIEKDNMVTKAVASILAHNYSGLTDFSRILPLRQLYSGCLLFQNEIIQNADNFNIPNEIDNPMIANAGDTAAATQSSTRGNPNATESEMTDTSLKQVWDWPTSAGNGTIRTVCLCPGSTLGNMGTKPIDNTINCWAPIAVNNNIGNIGMRTMTRELAKAYPISMDEDGQTGRAIWWTGTTFEEIVIRKDLSAFGIIRGIHEFAEVSSRTATVRSFTDNKANLFEDSEYYYLYEVTGATTLKIDKVRKSDMTVTQMDVTYSNISLYTGDQRNNGWRRCVPRWAYDGTYLYIPNAAGNGFVAVNPNDSSDVIIIDGTISVRITDTAPQGGTRIRPIVIGPKMIYGEDYIINGHTVYPIRIATPVYGQSAYTSSASMLNTIRQGAAVWAYPFRDQNYDAEGQGAVLLSFFLSTIMVLDSPVVKSTSQTMKLEYTLTEVFS